MSLHPDFLTRPIAHRALHDRAQGRPENSRAAIRSAIAAGYGIEIDLQVSRDGVAMVFHDDELDRLTDATGPVRAHSAAELGATLLTDAEDGIPTLTEVLAIVAGRVPLLIEIKDQSGAMGPDMAGLPEAAARALHGYAGPVALMSFNPHAVSRMAQLTPGIPRGITSYDWVTDRLGFITDVPMAKRTQMTAIPHFDAVGASFISHFWRDLSHPRVAELQAQGAAILCWTIRNRDHEAEARRIAGNITFEGYEAVFPDAGP